MDNGADPNLVPTNQKTALDVLIRRGWLPYLSEGDRNKLLDKFLANGANIHAVDNKGWSLLHTAASLDDLGTLEYLIEHGVNLDAVNNQGDTALHVAAYSFKEKALKRLLEAGANQAIKNHHNLYAREQCQETYHAAITILDKSEEVEKNRIRLANIGHRFYLNSERNKIIQDIKDIGDKKVNYNRQREKIMDVFENFNANRENMMLS